VIAENWPFSTSLAGTVTNKNQDQKRITLDRGPRRLQKPGD